MRPPRARVLALTLVLSLIALGGVACTSGDDEAPPSEPFVPVSRAVETEAGVLAVDWDPIASSLSRAVRLDADTLEALPGEARMSLGGPIDPTARWLAVFDPGRGGSQPEQVLVYDLETWELAWSVDDLPHGQLAWHNTGLYLWGDDCEKPARMGGGVCDVDWTRGLWRLAPDGADEIVRFDFGPVSGTTVMTSEGARAAVIGVETNMCCGIDPVGAPFLAIIDVATGEVASRIELRELRVGQPGDWLGSTDHLFGGQYVPELALSPDGTLAYVVHAEVDRVTVVNLDRSEVVSSHAFGDEDSMAARLGSWLLDRFARTAEAKMTAQYLRRAALTPDGRYLLISGVTVEETPDEVPTDGFVNPVGGGFLVVDVQSMEVVHEQPSRVDFALSPDGYSVLTWSWFDGTTNALGVSVLDLRTMEVRRAYDEEFVGEAFTSPDGRTGYVRLTPLHGPGRLVAFDLATFEHRGEHVMEETGNGGYWPHVEALEFSR